MPKREPDLFDLTLSESAVAGDAASLSAIVLVFPLSARLGKVRDVAAKLVATKSDRHAVHYRMQVTEALCVHLRSKHVPTDRHAGEIANFWREVDLECARIMHGRWKTPGGTV